MALITSESWASVACDEGKVMIKLSYKTNINKHLNGIAATLVKRRVNVEKNNKAYLE